MRTRLIRGALLLAGILDVGIRARAASDAAKTPVVLELFTSEGCSSCPPADRLLQSLDQKQPFSRTDLIVLSEHVDYWNGSAWVDPYSSKLFSERQRSYAEYFRLDTVYTPQAVIDGQRETVGSNAVEIRNAVEAATRNQKVAVMLSKAVRDGNRIKFHLTSADLPRAAGPFSVYVAVAENKVQSNVAGGRMAAVHYAHRRCTHIGPNRSSEGRGLVIKGRHSSHIIRRGIQRVSRRGSPARRSISQNRGAAYEKIQG